MMTSPARAIAALLFGTILTAFAAAADPAPSTPTEGGKVAVLHRAGPWRVMHSWARPMVQTDAGPRPGVMKRFREASDPDVANFDFLTRYPPAGWAAPDFDDSGWGRRHFFLRYWNGETDGRARSGSPSEPGPCWTSGPGTPAWPIPCSTWHGPGRARAGRTGRSGCTRPQPRRRPLLGQAAGAGPSSLPCDCNVIIGNGVGCRA